MRLASLAAPFARRSQLFPLINSSLPPSPASETNYSCLMLKSQRFSSLFRHYAKYHGLKKDTLEYFFVSELQNDDTPESVMLQRGDVIMVQKKKEPENVVVEVSRKDKELRKSP